MRIKLFALVLIAAAVLPPALQSQTPPPEKTDVFQRPRAVPEFSEPQGRLGWEQAMAKCASLKMRLPTPYEMQAAFESKLMKGWEKGMYWTSGEDEDLSLGLAYLSHYGVIRVESKGYANLVRCSKP